MSIRVWHVLVFVAALIVFAVARAPAGVFAPSREGAFSYQRAEGTIWSARFTRARLGPFDAGDVTWRLSLIGLVNGKFVADVAMDGAELSGQGQLLANWRGDRRLVAQTLRLQGVRLAPDLRLAGETSAHGLDLFFERGICRTALGALASDVLSRNVETFNWSGPTLFGAASCAGEDARLTLAAAEDAATVQAELFIRADGAGRWRAEVRGARPEAQAALIAVGFAPDASGQGLVKEDAWAGY